MDLRNIISALVVCSSLSTFSFAQEDSARLARPIHSVSHAYDFSKTVVPITETRLSGFHIRAKLGSGFCLDTECRFIVTTYHVATMDQPKKVKGQKIAHVYLATGPDDDGASVIAVSSKDSMKFNLSRDLALLELRHPVPQFHGVAFGLDELKPGQDVDIFAFPKESATRFRDLTRFHGTFKGETSTGLLAFHYQQSAEKGIRGGGSGGIVVDSQTGKIVGVLSEIADGGEAIALAVPTQALADFMSKVKPCLAQTVFPPIREIYADSADFYPKFVAAVPSVPEHRPEETADVRMLRSKAQKLTDGMRNFIAVQTFFWGAGNRPPAADAAYEVRVLDGHQRFREYPSGKKYSDDAPLGDLNRDISTGSEWSDLPQMVGTELHLKIHQATDVVKDNQQFKIFQYWADKEDAVHECQFLTIADFGFFSIKKVSANACYGEVWTDGDLNILRISLHLELPGKWQRYQTVVTYGWLKRPNDVLRLVPLTISAQAEYNRRVYWCRGAFMNYQVFGSRAIMLASAPASATGN